MRAQGAGLALLGLLWLGPLPQLAAVSLSAHMLLHVGVATAAPALLRLRPARRPGAGLLIAAGVAELLVVWGWHLPGPHLRASLDDGAFVLQQASFLAAGLAVWTLAEAAGRLAAAALLLFTGMHMALLGALLGLAPELLYPGVCGGGPGGLSPLEDQQLGGMLMATLGPAICMAGGLARLAPLLREEEAS